MAFVGSRRPAKLSLLRRRPSHRQEALTVWLVMFVSLFGCRQRPEDVADLGQNVILQPESVPYLQLEWLFSAGGDARDCGHFCCNVFSGSGRSSWGGTRIQDLATEVSTVECC